MCADERRQLIQELVKLHVDSQANLQAGLTDEQKKLPRDMLGKAFDIAALLEGSD